jgi:hypothetical protein
MLPNMPNIICLFDGIEMASDLFDTAARRADDVVIAPKVLNKEILGSCCIGLIAAIRHRLPAACLVEWVIYMEPEPLQKLKSGYPNLGKDHVNIAGYKEADPLVHEEHFLSYCCCLRRHIDSPFGLGNYPAVTAVLV